MYPRQNPNHCTIYPFSPEIAAALPLALVSRFHEVPAANFLRLKSDGSGVVLQAYPHLIVRDDLGGRRVAKSVSVQALGHRGARYLPFGRDVALYIDVFASSTGGGRLALSVHDQRGIKTLTGDIAIRVVTERGRLSVAIDGAVDSNSSDSDRVEHERNASRASDAMKSLRDFIATTFTVAEFVRAMDGFVPSAALPARGSYDSRADYAALVVKLLFRRGLLGPEFFSLLREARPALRATIDEHEERVLSELLANQR